MVTNISYYLNFHNSFDEFLKLEERLQPVIKNVRKKDLFGKERKVIVKI